MKRPAKRRPKRDHSNGKRGGVPPGHQWRAFVERLIEALPALLFCGLLTGGVALYIRSIPAPPPRKPPERESQMTRDLSRMSPNERRKAEAFLSGVPEPVIKKKEPWER